MKRDAMFSRTVVDGMWCLVNAYPATWLEGEAHRLEPLAKQALSLSVTIRDHRDELYRTLMRLSVARKDEREAANLGSLWLDELDAIKPANDEERSAVDIARVECIQVFGDPRRVLPALIASERKMPNNWNASVRVAQMEEASHDYDSAIAACDRGLSRSPGPLGRSWLLQIKAHAFLQKGKTERAHDLLIDALEYAQVIPGKQARDNNVTRIKRALQEWSKSETRKN
jgi:tetratricopeptide (TPR) repeat protein